MPLARAFLVTLCATATAFNAPHQARPSSALFGESVRVKFRIHKDGRIEETVSGIKGSDCTKITEELNEKLGEVIKTEATEEMFEQKVEVEETNTVTVYDQKFSEW